MPKLLKVISTATVWGGKEELQKLVLNDEDKTKNHFLYRIFGDVNGMVIGTSRYTRTDKETGEVVPVEWVKLSGEFIAINSKGEEYSAAMCFLPDYVTGPFREALSRPEPQSITFGFDVFANYDKQSATSYIFVCQPLKRTDDGEQSQLERLAEKFAALPLPEGAAQKALPAPKKK